MFRSFNSFKVIFNGFSKLSRHYCNRTKFVNVSKILDNSVVGEKVEITGWIKSVRKQKQAIFLDLNDGSTCDKLQIILPPDLDTNSLSPGASISATGLITLSTRGQIELNANNIKVYNSCHVEDGYPFAPRKKYAPEYIRQFPHLRPKTSKFSSLLRLRNTATLAIHDFFQKENFIHIHTPILTSNDCEGAGEIFKVVPDSEILLKSMQKDGQKSDEIFFNSKAFLTVSGQMHLEAVANGLEKVYTFGPTFRAENSKSRLHLAEFYMVEAEFAFVENLNQLISLIENLIKTVTKTVLEKSLKDIEVCQKSKEIEYSWIDKEFPILEYDKAADLIKKNSEKFKESFNSMRGFAKEHELFLVRHCGNIPVFVVNWPKIMKPFYMKECQDHEKVAALDLLAPEVGEIVGGSLREDDYKTLSAKIPNNSDFEWYLDLRKYGGVPTAGFGLGFERYIQTILNVDNIKDAIPFPRWPHNCPL